jgi:beta-glucosidase
MSISATTLKKLVLTACAVAAAATIGSFAATRGVHAQSAEHKKFTLVADADARAEKILKQMTLDEKIDYIGGVNSMYVRAIPRLGLPAFKMSDGPLGVRGTGDSTAYPAGIMEAANWNPELEYEVGVQVGRDAKARGVTTMLGPGMNIYRAPMCGRNFEYFGEDPFLASRMAVAVIDGIQSEGVIATAKHYMGNNQEYDRYNVSSDIDERTMREIYLPAFEASVTEAHVGAIMDSYNLINGEHATQNKFTNIEVAKKDWGFQGVIMSDWDATHDGVAAANGGLDLEMPSGRYMNRETLLPAVKDGRVSEATIDDKVRRVLRLMIAYGYMDRPELDPNASVYNQEGRRVALEAAEGGMVLLKNSNILPLDKTKLKTIAVIGPEAFPVVPEGGGSAHVDPIVSGSFLTGIGEYLGGTDVNVVYESGTTNAQTTFGATDFTTTADGKTAGLKAEYFTNVKLEGKPESTRVDKSVNFGWDYSEENAPAGAVAARWTGFFIPKTTGEYTIYAGGHDGFRVSLDDKNIMTQWDWESTSTEGETYTFEAGQPHKLVMEYFRKDSKFQAGLGVVFAQNAAVENAKSAAAKADAVILCVGFDTTTEGEGRDRTFKLPGGQNALVNAILAANKNTTIVLSGGGNVDMTQWIDNTPALLHVWYPGQEGGRALAAILFGDVSPSGKLPVSFEREWKDNATYNSYYDNGTKHVKYSEGVFLGYRHFDKSSVKPMFPFGFGLSYTTFKYGNLNVTPSFKHGDPVTVTFDVTNTGGREGAEVGQVYVSDTHASVPRPIKELKGFGKVNLKPGETKTITVKLNDRSFSYYDVSKKAWVAEPGDFGILVGSSSAKIELTGKTTLAQ